LSSFGGFIGTKQIEICNQETKKKQKRLTFFKKCAILLMRREVFAQAKTSELSKAEQSKQNLYVYFTARSFFGRFFIPFSA